MILLKAKCIISQTSSLGNFSRDKPVRLKNQTWTPRDFSIWECLGWENKPANLPHNLNYFNGSYEEDK